MKSTLLNMTAVLFGITLVASAGVGAVNMITAAPIAAAEEAARTKALEAVVPAFDAQESQELTIDELPITVFTTTNGGTLTGYAVQTVTKNGFGGSVELMVGFSPAGEILNINVLKQSETPGLGTKMKDEGNPLIRSVQGRTLTEKLAVKKDGGDVDALTAATISSRAYVDAVNRAWVAFRQVAEAAPVEEVDATTSATNTAATTDNEPEAQEGGQNE